MNEVDHATTKDTCSQASQTQPQPYLTCTWQKHLTLFGRAASHLSVLKLQTGTREHICLPTSILSMDFLFSPKEKVKKISSVGYSQAKRISLAPLAHACSRARRHENRQKPFQRKAALAGAL